MIGVHISFFQGCCLKKKPRLRDEDLYWDKRIQLDISLYIWDQQGRS